jgi:hypothetical protein
MPGAIARTPMQPGSTVGSGSGGKGDVERGARIGRAPMRVDAKAAGPQQQGSFRGTAAGKGAAVGRAPMQVDAKSAGPQQQGPLRGSAAGKGAAVGTAPMRADAKSFGPKKK